MLEAANAPMGTLAQRPPATMLNKDRLYLATDKGLLFVSTGSAWVPVTLDASMIESGVLSPERLGAGMPTSDAVLHPDGWRNDKISTLREVLAANRTYYVRTDGSNSNDGLANTAGGAFLTLAKAAAVVGTLDLSVYAVTIQFGNAGTYAGAVITGIWVGGPGSSVTIKGDTASPSSYVISDQIAADYGCVINVQGLKFTSSNYGVHASNKSTINVDGTCDFGVCTNAHIIVERQSAVIVTANCTISGGAGQHIYCTNNAFAFEAGVTLTLTGTPAFSSAWVYNEVGSTGQYNANTYTGSATGTRYVCNSNSVIDTKGNATTYFPGNAAGTTATGGQYV